MSALEWQDWSCRVRVVLADGRPAGDPPASSTGARVRAVTQSLMDDVARACSRFDPASDVSFANAHSGRMTPVGRRALQLVEVALQAAHDTEGACDPTIGRDLASAGYDADIAAVRAREPGSFGPASLPDRTRADWTAVRTDPRLGLIGVPRGVHLDLGATAKAWTADAAAMRLHETLDVPVLVSLGGDVAVRGDGVRWPILVSEHAGDAGEVITLDHGGVATSSTRGRAWQGPDGDRHHIIDPRTGRSAVSPLRTVSVVARTCLTANTLSTAALVWGAEAPHRLSTHAARWVTTDGRVVHSEPWWHLGTDGVAA